MTTTLEPDTTVEAEPLTIRIGDITITAASEQQALSKYKRLVRAEALRAQIDNDWCDTGTNERLERLGLRKKGEGIPVRVRLVAERTAYMVLDVDTQEEADQVLASGEDPELLSLVTTSVGRGWKALVVEAAPRRTGKFQVGDPDDTGSGPRIGSTAYITMCEQYSAGRGYCTREAGHLTAGDLQHAVGNGDIITAVWDEEVESTMPVVGKEFADFARGGTRCRDRGTETTNPDRYVCTRRAGHDGQHVGATSDHLVVGIWDRED